MKDALHSLLQPAVLVLPLINKPAVWLFSVKSEPDLCSPTDNYCPALGT